MGHTTSNTNETGSIKHRDYTLKTTLFDPNFGEIYAMKHRNTGNILFMKEHINLEQKAYQLIIKECRSKLNLEHPGLLKLLGFSAENLNSDTHKIKIFFEPFVKTLQQEVIKRKNSTRSVGTVFKESQSKCLLNHFTEQELLEIILKLIETFSFLQLNKINHGDIRTNTICVTAVGEIKTIDRKLVYDKRSSLQLVLLGNHDILLSPISMLERRKKKIISQNGYKADVFSLGMTFIEMATLEKISQCYDWEKCEINLNMLEDRLIEIKRRYSERIYLIIREMIRFNEEERPDFLLLKEKILKEGKNYQINRFKTINNVNFLEFHEFNFKY